MVTMEESEASRGLNGCQVKALPARELRHLGEAVSFSSCGPSDSQRSDAQSIHALFATMQNDPVLKFPLIDTATLQPLASTPFANAFRTRTIELTAAPSHSPPPRDSIHVYVEVRADDRKPRVDL
jgi:hypothetical protein